MRRRRLWAAVVLLATAARAGAHWLTPETIVAEIAGQRALGVERAERDPHNARVLLVHVGPRWQTLPAETRAERAQAWRAAWRHSVAQGVVAVVDARGAAVLHFNIDGTADVGARPHP